MLLIKLLHELLSKWHKNVCWFCAGHQFEEPPTGARQWSMVKVLSTLHASLCLQTNHQISFHYNHHHHHNNNHNNNNSLEQPTPSNCHSFMSGQNSTGSPLRQPQIVIEAVQGVRIDSIAALGIQTGNISPGLETHHQPHLWLDSGDMWGPGPCSWVDHVSTWCTCKTPWIHLTHPLNACYTCYPVDTWHIIYIPWMLLNFMDVHYIPTYPLLGKFFQLFLFTVRSQDTLDDAKMLSSSSSRVAKLVRTSGTMAGTPHRLKPATCLMSKTTCN